MDKNQKIVLDHLKMIVGNSPLVAVQVLMKELEKGTLPKNVDRALLELSAKEETEVLMDFCNWFLD